MTAAFSTGLPLSSLRMVTWMRDACGGALYLRVQRLGVLLSCGAPVLSCAWRTAAGTKKPGTARSAAQQIGANIEAGQREMRRKDVFWKRQQRNMVSIVMLL